MPAITFSGLASGIDADAIIKSVIDARTLQSAPMRAKVSNNETENTALEEFNTKLLSFNDTLKDFLTLSGSSVSKIAQSSNESAATASVGSTAIASTTSIKVLNLAKSASASFAQTFNDLNAPVAPGLTGPTTLQVKVGTGDSAKTFAVEVTPETTVAELVDSINSGSPGGEVAASVVNVGTSTAPQYKIVVGSSRTGLEAGSLEITPSDELNAAGALAIGNLQQAQDAVVYLDSVGNVTRSSNTITDLIPGVTLNLKQESPEAIIITVGNDTEKTAKRFAEVVAAMNEVIKYANDNSKIERVDSDKGPTNKYGTLARTRVDNRAVENIKQALSDARSGVDGSPVKSFFDAGIKTEKDGTISFDEKAFLKAVGSDPAAAGKLLQGFADKVGSATGVVAEYTKFQGGIDLAVKSNDEELRSLNDRLSRIEANLEQQTQALRLQFSRLEQRTAQLNSNADALSSLYSSYTRR